MPRLTSMTVVCICLVTFQCANVHSYSDKCAKISPIQELKASVFQGIWHLHASNKAVPFRCVNYYNVILPGNTVKTVARAESLNGTVYNMSFNWKIKVSENPKGITGIMNKGYYGKPEVIYFIDARPTKTAITYMCEEEGDGVNEQVIVYTLGDLDFDRKRLATILKKNNLSHVKVENTYLHCPKAVENIKRDS